MKIALAQIDTTIGDFTGNAKKILHYSDRARLAGADLCIFPEQCIPGYPGHDLLERDRFIARNMETLKQIVSQTKDFAVIVGFAEPHNGQYGKDLFNSAAFIQDGKVISIHRKMLLPTYDVFDEQRYFDPATQVNPVEFKGKKLGITICEDVWNDPDFWTHPLYKTDPGTALVKKGAEIIINIAASPFALRKRQLRRNMLQKFAKHHQTPLLFVNSVGGNDDLVFDGSSIVLGPDGALWADAKSFEEDLIFVDLDSKSGNLNNQHFDDTEAALEALILGVGDYIGKCGFKRVLLGLSGGIDSALVAVIAARAIGAENVEALLMPSPYSSDGSVKDAEALAHNLRIPYQIIPIEDTFKSYLNTLSPFFGTGNLGVTQENLQARIRGNLLMAFSNRFGHLLLTTGNKSEMATGYCTLYGDMAGGLAVLSDVPKTLVYDLCHLINRNEKIIPQAIIDKPPSAELSPDQLDSDSLPPYELLDKILELHIVENMDYRALVEMGFDAQVVESVLTMVARNEYKRRQAPPGIKITSKAFGFGRRIPLAQSWRPRE